MFSGQRSFQPLVSRSVVALGTGTIFAGNMSLDPVTWWRMTPSLKVLDGGKKGVLRNMLFGWGKWLRPFGPLGTAKGMDDLVSTAVGSCHFVGLRLPETYLGTRLSF